MERVIKKWNVYIFLSTVIIFFTHCRGDSNKPAINSVTINENTLPVATVNSSLPVGKLTFLAFNLGADASLTVEQQIAYSPVNEYDAIVFGDLYQWGRNTDGHEKRTSDTTSIQSNSDIPRHGKFITTTNDPHDWHNPQNGALWGATKTANDPCPSGFRVPTKIEWESIGDGVSDNIWAWTSYGYKISPDGGKSWTLFLPAGGYRGVDGSVRRTAFEGNYWCSPSFRHYAWAFSFNANEGPDWPRSLGYSVRCIKEY